MGRWLKSTSHRHIRRCCVPATEPKTTERKQETALKDIPPLVEVTDAGYGLNVTIPPPQKKSSSIEMESPSVSLEVEALGEGS